MRHCIAQEGKKSSSKPWQPPRRFVRFAANFGTGAMFAAKFGPLPESAIMAAFFKLALQDGSEREWRSLSAVVGRASSGRERDDLIDLGEQPRLSREHLAIFYDPAKKRWMAKVCARRRRRSATA